MPTYSIKGPGGKTYSIEGPEGATRDQVVSAIQRRLAAQQPPQSAQPETQRERLDLTPRAPETSLLGGMGTEFRRGAAGLTSAVRTALGATFGDPEEAAQAALERSEAMAQRYGEGPSLAQIQETYREDGLLPAVGEAIGDIPELLAGQAPQLLSTAAAARTGFMLGGPYGAGLGALASLVPQFTGYNIERQAETQRSAGEPLDIDVAKAAGTATLQAVPELASQYFILGKGLVSRILGRAPEQTTGAAAREAAEQLKTVAERSLRSTVGRGAVRGAATEIPTEVAQQVLERAQAGLDVLSPDALAEYGESAYLAGVLGGTLGPVGGVSRRAQARQQLEARGEGTDTGTEPPPVTPEAEAAPEVTPPPAAPEPEAAPVVEEPEAEAEPTPPPVAPEPEAAPVVEEPEAEAEPTPPPAAPEPEAAPVVEEPEAEAEPTPPPVAPEPEAAPVVEEPEAEPQAEPTVEEQIAAEQRRIEREESPEIGMQAAAEQLREQKLAEKAVQQPTPDSDVATVLAALDTKVSKEDRYTPEASARLYFGSSSDTFALAEEAETKYKQANVAEELRSTAEAKQFYERNAAETDPLDIGLRSMAFDSVRSTDPGLKLQNTNRQADSAIQFVRDNLSPETNAKLDSYIAEAELAQTQQAEVDAQRDVSDIATKVTSAGRGPLGVTTDDLAPINMPPKRAEKVVEKVNNAPMGKQKEVLAQELSRFQALKRTPAKIKARVKALLATPAFREFGLADRDTARGGPTLGGFYRPEVAKELENNYVKEVTDNDIQDGNVQDIADEALDTKYVLDETVDSYEDAVELMDEMGFSPEMDYLRADAVSNVAGPASPQTQEKINEGDLVGALEQIAKDAPNAVVKRIATKLAKTVRRLKLEGTNVSTVPDVRNLAGEAMAGGYSVTDGIQINGSIRLTNHTVLHETAHLVTDTLLTNKSHPVTKRLQRLYEEAKTQLPSTYGLESLRDFVAEAYTNTDFQAALAAAKRTKKQPSLLRRFFSVVGDILGLPTQKPENLLDETIRTIDAVLAPSKETIGSAWFQDKQAEDPEGAMEYMAKADIGFADKNILQKAIAHVVSAAKRMPRKTKLAIMDGLSLQNLVRALKDTPIAEEAKRLEELLAEQDGLRTKETQEFSDTLQRFVKAFKGDTQAMDILDGVVATSTINEVDPTKPEDKYSSFGYQYIDNEGKVQEKYGFKTEKAAAAARDVAVNTLPEADRYTDPVITRPNSEKVALHKQLKAQLNKLNPEQRAVYSELRDAYAQMNGKILKAIDSRLEMFETDSNTKRLIKERIFKKILTSGVIDPYFPLDRSGDYWLRFTAADPSGQQQVVLKAFESPAQQEAAEAALKADPLVDKDSIEKLSLDDLKSKGINQNIPTSMVLDLQQAIKRLGVTEELSAELDKVLLRTLPEQALLQGYKNRKNIPGFEPRALEAFQNRMQISINSYANLLYEPQISALQKQITDKLENKQAFPDDSFQRDLAIAIAGTKDQTDQIGFKLPSYVEFAKNPRVSNTIRTIRSGIFQWTLGLNPSSAAVNLVALPTVVGPQLQGKFGPVRGLAALNRAMSIYTKSFGRDEDGKISVGVSNLDPSRGADSQTARALAPLTQRMVETGQDKRTINAEMADLDNPTSTFLKKLSFYFGFLFNHSERFIRQVSAAGHYIASVEKRFGKKFDQVTDAELTENAEELQRMAQEAIDFMDWTNSSAVITTAPRYAQSGVGSLIYQYKRYPAQIAALQFSMLKALLRQTTRDKNRTPEQISEDNALVRALGYTYLNGGVLLGAKGLPLYGILSAAWNMFLDEDEEDANTIVAKTVGPGWYYGFLASQLGIDITDRAALTNLMVRDRGNYRPQNNADATIQLVESYGGPTIGIGLRIAESAAELRDGNPRNNGRAIENMLPTSVSNMAKTYRLATDGYETRRGDPIVGNVAVGDAVRQVAGFRPAKFRLEQEKMALNYRMNRGRTERRSRLMDRYYYALKGDSPERPSDVLKDILEYNRDHPEYPIEDSNLEASARTRSRNDIVAGLTGGMVVDRRFVNEVLQSNREFGGF